MAIGQYKQEGDNQHTKDTLDYYQWLAKLADRGKISCIFFADVYGGMLHLYLPELFIADLDVVEDMYESSGEACFTTGSGVGWLDPQSLVAGMASVSKSVSFGITGSTSYINVSSFSVNGPMCVLTNEAVHYVPNSSNSRSYYEGSLCLECCDQLFENCCQGNGKDRGSRTR